MQEPIRKRIVIDFEQPRNGPSKRVQGRTSKNQHRRLWPKVMLISAALGVFCVMVVACAGFFWWRYFQTTPGYTLAVMIDAAQKNDSETFDRQIDDEAVARGMVANISDKAASQYGLTLNGPLRKQVERLLPSLLPALRQRLHREIENEIRELTAASGQQPFILIALAISRLTTITTDGSSAKATATFQNRKVELLMRLDNEQWKVIGFNDDVLTQKIVNDVVGNLPTMGGLNIDNLLKPGKKPGNESSNSH